MLTYADVYWRMLTYADVCQQADELGFLGVNFSDAKRRGIVQRIREREREDKDTAFATYRHIQNNA
jgi:hypothetical protein